MNLKGKLHEIGVTQQVTESFKKRDIVVVYSENPQYPEYIKLEAHKDMTDKLDGFNIGDEVELEFNLRGRPWTNKDGVTTYFNSLVVWKATKLGGSTATTSTDIDAPLPF